MELKYIYLTSTLIIKKNNKKKTIYILLYFSLVSEVILFTTDIDYWKSNLNKYIKTFSL